MASHRPPAVEQGEEGRAGVRVHPVGGFASICCRGWTTAAGERPAGSAPLEVLVQVDFAGEATKFGAPPEEAERIVRAGAASLTQAPAGWPDAVPPWSEDPEATRPWFVRLREFPGPAARRRRHPGGLLRHLSMGMSHDYEAAIEEGATIVRVGTAIFGNARQKVDHDAAHRHGASDGRDDPRTSAPAPRRRHARWRRSTCASQRFRTVVRGFDKTEVVAFLTEAADDYETRSAKSIGCGRTSCAANRCSSSIASARPTSATRS